MKESPTPKQQKLIKLIFENLGTPKNTKTMGELILEAGYSKAMSTNPQQIFRSETIQDGISDFIKSLDDKRRLALKEITPKKLEKAPARENAYIVDILTKNMQLLSGGETSRVGVKPIYGGLSGHNSNKEDIPITE